MVYLDHAATAPVFLEVAETVYLVLHDDFANPSAQYEIGRKMQKKMEYWRDIIAEQTGFSAERLFFTSGGTEGNNWAIRSACRYQRHKGKHIVTTAVEHSAVLETCKDLEKQGYSVTYVQPDTNGDIPAERVLEAVRDDTVLVSIMLVNNELGNIYPVAEIGRALREKYPNVILHTDAVQAFMKSPWFMHYPHDADLITLSGHKIGAPKGIGALCISPRLKNFPPLLTGGGQERGLRSGTEATAQVAGFSLAVELMKENFAEISSSLEKIKAYAIDTLGQIPDVEFLGDARYGSENILALSLVGWPSQSTVSALAQEDIYISAGSACHQGRPSHVIAALKLPKRVAGGAIRISFGPKTSYADIDALARALRKHHDTRMPML